MTEEKKDPCRDSEGPRAGAEEASEADRECAKRRAETEAGRRGSSPPIDFSTFAFSLATQALVSLGETQLPGQAPAGPPNIEAAKPLIDILAMLEEKTRGNLSEAEARLLSNLLYDLRMRYVQVARRQGAHP